MGYQTTKEKLKELKQQNPQLYKDLILDDPIPADDPSISVHIPKGKIPFKMTKIARGILILTLFGYFVRKGYGTTFLNWGQTLVTFGMNLFSQNKMCQSAR